MITGGFGFLGGRIAQHLSDNGHEVLLGSRMVKKSPAWCPKVNTILTDWNNPQSLISICTGVDFIIHAAGMNASDCADDFGAAIIANGLNTSNIVRAAEENGVKGFIYLSTAHVYSSKLAGNVTEEQCPLNLHPYATTHRIGEDVVLATSQANKINGIVFRLSNAFGVPASVKSDAWLLLVNDICKQAVETEKIVLRSGGKQYRDFISMKAVVQSIAKAIELMNAGEIEGEVFNLGSGKTLSVLEMTKLVSSRYKLLFNKEIKIERNNNDDSYFEPMNFAVDKIMRNRLFIPSDFKDEIDSLLLFCRRNFSRL